MEVIKFPFGKVGRPLFLPVLQYLSCMSLCRTSCFSRLRVCRNSQTIRAVRTRAPLGHPAKWHQHSPKSNSHPSWKMPLRSSDSIPITTACPAG